MTESSRKLPSRREILGAVAAGGALVATAGPLRSLASAQSRPARGAQPRPVARAAADVCASLGISEGSVLGGCRVLAVYAVNCGSIPVVLATRHGRQFQLDVLRREEGTSAPPLAASGSLAIYSATAEQQERPAHLEAANALAVQIRAAELAGARAPALLTHAERATRHPGGTFMFVAV